MVQNRNKKNIKKKIKTAIVLFGLLLSILTSLFIIWDRWKPNPNEILLEPLAHIQTPFEINQIQHTREIKGPELEIKWTAYFAITNLRNESIAIEDISVDFTSDKTLNKEWSLLGEKIESPLFLWAYVTDDERFFRDKDSTIVCTFQPGPFIIPSGAKKVFGFDLNYDLYKNKQKIIPTNKINTGVLVQRLIGGYLLSNGSAHAIYGPINVKLKIAKKGHVTFKTKTVLWVVGSTFYNVRIQ